MKNIAGQQIAGGRGVAFQQIQHPLYMSTNGRTTWPTGPVIRIESSCAVSDSNCVLSRKHCAQVRWPVIMNYEKVLSNSNERM
jgi:hypothetical protein